MDGVDIRRLANNIGENSLLPSSASRLVTFIKLVSLSFIVIFNVFVFVCLPSDFGIWGCLHTTLFGMGGGSPQFITYSALKIWNFYFLHLPIWKTVANTGVRGTPEQYVFLWCDSFFNSFNSSDEIWSLSFDKYFLWEHKSKISSDIWSLCQCQCLIHLGIKLHCDFFPPRSIWKNFLFSHFSTNDFYQG